MGLGLGSMLFANDGKKALTKAGLSILDIICKESVCIIILPYPRKRGPMGGAPYIGSKLGDGPIFEVSVSRLYSKERPGKLPMLAS